MLIKRVLIAVIFLFVSGSAHAVPTELVNDAGFEATVANPLRLTWTSAVYGTWGVGDEIIPVIVENGISPNGGTKMLRFDNTAGNASDVYQIIDVSSFASEIDAGLVTVDLSAFFNATATTTMGLRLLGWDFAPLNFNLNTVQGGTTNNSNVDGDVAAWEQFSVTGIAVNANIRFLAVGMHEPTGGAFAYADDVSALLTVADSAPIPEPGTLALFVFGLVGLGFARRKRAA